MKLTITGSLGNISGPLAKELVANGHAVTVISHNAAKQKQIEAIGATAAIGSVDDTAFLTRTFSNADAVYCMTPPQFHEPDQVAYYEKTALNYATAIRNSGIKRVVYLSSYGAHLPGGTGFITGSYKAEKILESISNIWLTHIRPTYFYYNLQGFIPMIKAMGWMGAVYGGTDRLPMVAPADIAMAVAEELVQTSSNRKICYVTSDERTCEEIAMLLGKSVGIPDLQWRVLPEPEALQGLLHNHVPANAAANLVDLGKAIHEGLLREDFDRHTPVWGKTKLEHYLAEFSAIYHQ